MPILTENFKMRPRYNWYSKIIRKYYKIRVNLTKPRFPICDSEVPEKAEREEKLIIQIPFGGLGDHLAYSSLPELLWEQKSIKTFISNKSILRSPEICDFVWGLNPYITFTDEKGWFTYKPLEHDCSTIDEYFQKLFELQSDGCPKVYYKPKAIEQIKGKTIVDPSFGPSGKANGYYEKDFRDRFIDYLGNNIGDFVLIIHKHEHTRNELQQRIINELNPPVYCVSTIEELANTLFSAKDRYLLHSGAASLSAALNLPSNILNYLKPSTFAFYKYRVNNYIDLKLIENKDAK